MPNFVQLGRTVAGIWPFSIFQDGGCPPSWIFKSWEILTAFGGPKMRHRTKFCADRSNRCGDMAVFNFSRWRPSAILDFQNLDILTACTLRGTKMRHRAKFCADRSRRCGDMAVFDFSRWRPSAILDLLYACLDPPRSVFWWSLSLCKIWFESVEWFR